MELVITQKGLYNTNPDRRKYFKGGKMPLTKKGKKIMSSMKSQYGEKKGKKVFYASKNKGIIKKVDMPGMSVHPMVNCNQQIRNNKTI